MASMRRNRIRNGRDVSSGSSSSNSQEKRNTIKREFSELYPDPQETISPVPDAPPGAAAAAAASVHTPKRPVLLTVNLAGTTFTKGKFLRDIRKRWAAAACDAGVSCGIALCAFAVLGHFWTPLGVAMLCYYAGGIVLLGNTPGVCLFAPDRNDVRFSTHALPEKD